MNNNDTKKKEGSSEDRAKQRNQQQRVEKDRKQRQPGRQPGRQHDGGKQKDEKRKDDKRGRKQAGFWIKVNSSERKHEKEDDKNEDEKKEKEDKRKEDSEEDDVQSKGDVYHSFTDYQNLFQEETMDSYEYLEKANLPKEIPNDITQNKNIETFLVFVKVNNNCKIPFLEFALHVSATMNFVNKNDLTEESTFSTMLNEFTNANHFNVATHSDDLFGGMQMEEMKPKDENIQETFLTPEIRSSDIKYYGYIQEEDSLFVIFNIDPSLYTSSSLIFRWFILDEIVFESERYNIDATVINFIKNNPVLQNLGNKKHLGKTLFDWPQMLYMCKKENQENTLYHHVLSNESWIDLPSSHSIFGEGYLFTDSLILATTPPPTTIQRYAVFTTINDRYILRDIKHQSKEQLDMFLNKYENLDILTTFFKEDGVRIWHIKSPDQFTRLLSF